MIVISASTVVFGAKVSRKLNKSYTFKLQWQFPTHDATHIDPFFQALRYEVMHIIQAERVFRISNEVQENRFAPKLLTC